MNPGLNGRKAIVCASSRGLGKACVTSLAREGFISGQNLQLDGGSYPGLM